MAKILLIVKKTNRWPYVCTGCNKKYNNKCDFTKYKYDAQKAQDKADTNFVTSRKGLDIDDENFKQLDNIVKEGTDNKKSIYQIVIENKDVIEKSVTTLYRYVNKGYLTTKRIDLPCAVSYKKRKHNKKYEYSENKEIDRTDHTYCIRLKKNIKILIHGKNENHKIWKWLDYLKPLKYHAVVYKDIELYDSKYITNIVISKYLNTSDPWIIVTNKDIEHAIQNYSFRFGAVECVFKSQKSNGFFLEAVNNASEKAFTTMYTLVCTATLFLTIIGADYSKNTKCYKNELIISHKKYSNGKKVRVMSLFKVGLTLFHRAFNSLKYIRIPFRFILYDI